MDRIPIEVDGRPAAHLAVRLDQPAEPAAGGLAVLYMHGLGSDQAGNKATFFRHSLVSRGLAFCSFDFQGHGQSGGSMLDLSLSRNLADVGRVHAFLRQRGYERVVLMGSSMGGGTGLWYAALHPGEVLAGVHLAPSVSLDETLLEQLGPQDAARWERDGRLSFKSELMDCEIGWGLIEDLRSYPRDRLHSLYRTPTLVFQGKNDESVAWRKVVDFVTGCPYEALELHLFADGDHRLIDRLEHLFHLTLGFLTARGILPARAAA